MFFVQFVLASLAQLGWLKKGEWVVVKTTKVADRSLQLYNLRDCCNGMLTGLRDGGCWLVGIVG